jgi:hypothetical protein
MDERRILGRGYVPWASVSERGSLGLKRCTAVRLDNAHSFLTDVEHQMRPAMLVDGRMVLRVDRDGTSN